MRNYYIKLRGGLNEIDRGVDLPPGMLLRCKNVECKRTGGYASMKGYVKFDSSEVPGEGDILGVWRYNNKVYAFRNAVGGATSVMYESVGSGWTAKKTGLSPNGKYRCINANFYGTPRMYIASGVDKAAEWDGTTYTAITTGMATDTPTHIIAHKQHLFLSFGPSVQASPIGDPKGTWTPVTGATEILTESDVTGFMQMTGGVLGIFSRNSTNILQGTSTADWVISSMQQHGNEIGCIADTVQQLGSRVYYMDDRGVMDFRTAQEFGDFADATISTYIQPTVESKKDIVSASVVIKNKSQYRIFFTDKWGITATFDKNELVGWTRFELPLAVLSVCNDEDANGSEIIHFGSTDGYIYTMESSDEFDGAAIVSFIVTSPAHLGSPYKTKRFRRAQFDLQVDGVISLQAKGVFVLRDGVEQYRTVAVSGHSTALGEGLLGSVLLGGSDLQDGSMDMPGNGEYISMYFTSTAVQRSWELDGINYQYEFGRTKRS